MELASWETIENITCLKTSFEPSYLRETQVYLPNFCCARSALIIIHGCGIKDSHGKEN